MHKPVYTFSNANELPWQTDAAYPGIETKRLGDANGQTMELCRYAPNTAYPAHFHKGPEFLFIIEGSARLDGRWLYPGWSSAGETGTVDEDFCSGDDGCVFLAVYTP